MKSALGEETRLVPPLEDILQRKLDQSRSHGGACDPAEVRLRYVGIYWIRELGVVEEIEELRLANCAIFTSRPESTKWMPCEPAYPASSTHVGRNSYWICKLYDCTSGVTKFSDMKG